MVGAGNVVLNGVPHAPAVSHAVPDHPSGYCAARDEEPGHSDLYRPRPWGGRNAGSDINANLERRDPTTTRLASRARGPDASLPRKLGLPARRSGRGRAGASFVGSG